MTTKQPEQGAASIKVELRDSVITVYHGTDGDILKSNRVTDGAWTTLFNAVTVVMEAYSDEQTI